ncbi:ribosomal RNA small subunit methyltransferase NEP1 [Zootermopsis nevadensis]|uniref:18S rRNA (pseudouridine-N1)-methyltransferase n=1 Tax=Zootermopsis nevadensis TaxID=136037 RepID=A0A067REU3_ZOONE|nr:ribosomal RNA small subunit methyltransferase NEP1 [Zootermopsis nevadensis]KDR17463.1 putative ribosome biogenesis protein NEP1 [Zootermopsis nevadensis]
MGKKRKLGCKEDEFEFDPIPKHLVVAHLRNQEKRLIIILENAQLESVKVGNSFQLLNCDDHVSILKKYNRDIGSCRPDIVHQCLLMLLDSPLNRAGLLQVYIHTEKNVLIEINPQTRIPRTFKRFAGLIVQLLHKFSVRATDGPTKLLKVIRNPVTDHLPVGCRKLGTSFSAPNVVNPRDLVPSDEPVTVVVGAVAHGKVNPEYVESNVSISNYPLSAALTCTKLCSGFEEAWGVV